MTTIKVVLYLLLPVCAIAADAKVVSTEASIIQIAVATPPNNARTFGTGFFVGNDVSFRQGCMKSVSDSC
jgi:hypothetical protein